jgi:hypothetical protein
VFRSLRTALPTLLAGGLVVGGLDAIDAIVFFGARGASPTRIFQSIAAGLLGRDAAFGGGAPAVLLGGFLQLFNGFLVVLAYYLISRALPVLVARPVPGGLVYGPLVHLFMTYVVIPLSAIHRTPPMPLPVMLNGLIGHALLVGLPAAFAARAAGRPSAGGAEDSRPWAPTSAESSRT